MPAFQLSQQSPSDLLQLCGVKRKTESSVEEDYLCGPSYDQYPSSKRICLCPEEGFNGSVGNVLPLNESNQKESQSRRPVIVFGTNNDSSMTCDMQPQMPQSDSLLRVGEMLSVAGVTTTDPQMMDYMEVDCNATGKHLLPYDEQTLIQEVQAQIDRQFCEDHCGLGSISPASGLLRCYCRPSWEGMVEMQAYRSDYY